MLSLLFKSQVTFPVLAQNRIIYEIRGLSGDLEISDFLSINDMNEYFYAYSDYLSKPMTEVGEDGLCSLWDAINSEEVANFVVEYSLYDIILSILEKWPEDERLGELGSGICANLSQNATKSKLFQEWVILIFWI